MKKSKKQRFAKGQFQNDYIIMPLVILVVMFVFPISLIATIVTAWSLIFPEKISHVVITYGAYAVSLIVLTHAAILIFCHPTILTKKHFSRVPKYLEYAYTLILSFSLFQIVVSAPKATDFVVYTRGTQERIVENIRRQAQLHVKDDCTEKGEYFTAEYCNKLRKITEVVDLKEYVLQLASDRSFVYHVIGRQNAIDIYTLDEATWIYSPIKRSIEDYIVVKNFIQAPQIDERLANTLLWIGFILLPLGIALRLGKTSLELFGSAWRQAAQRLILRNKLESTRISAAAGRARKTRK